MIVKEFFHCPQCKWTNYVREMQLIVPVMVWIENGAFCGSWEGDLPRLQEADCACPECGAQLEFLHFKDGL